MKNKMSIQVVLGIMILVLCVFFTYKDIMQNFFEQDEWAAFATNIIFGQFSFLEKIKFLFSSSGIFSHLIPVTTYIFYLMNKVFDLQAVWYFMIIVILHISNTVFVYILTQKLTKNTLMAFCAGLFFGINWISSQAVTWFSAAFGAQLSTTFFLLSLLLYCIYLEKKKRKYFIASVVLFIFSFMSKETTLTLIIIYPLLIWYYTYVPLSHIFRKENRENFLWFFYSVILFFAFKILLLSINPFPVLATIGNSSKAPFILFPRLFLYPLLAFSQIYDPGGIIFHLSKPFVMYEYPQLTADSSFLRIVESIGPDVLYLLVSFVLIIFCIFTIQHMLGRNRRMAFLIIVLLVAFFLSILPYIPLPRFISLLEPRYYYTPNIFASILCVTCFWYWIHSSFLKQYTACILTIVTGVIIFFHFQQIQSDIMQKVLIAKERKALLSQMKIFLPVLSEKKNIFFMTGSGYDYLLPGLKIPFQSGFGNVLMVWYFDNTHIIPQLVENNFLYGLTEQGYRMFHGVGFGYYFEKNALTRDLKDKKFSVNNVHAFFWNRNKQKLSDITNVFQKDVIKQL